jgi:4-amino-4-deoxy-L-arabinose transferase-like glycosyltransferase
MTRPGKKGQNTKLIILVLLMMVLVMTGLSIRLINLGEPGFASDESFHVFSAKSILDTGEPKLPSGMPYKRALLYTKLVAFSFKLFGVNEFAARLPSAVLGTLTIVLIFFVGRAFFGTPAGVISALLYTVSPFAIIWARECRMYTIFQFFYLFGMFTFYSGFESSRPDNIRQTDPTKPWYSTREFITRSKVWGIDFKWLTLAGVLFYISLKFHSLTSLFGVSLIAYLLLMTLLSSSKNYFQGETKNKYLFSMIMLIFLGLLGLVMSPRLFYFIKNLFLWAPGWSSGMSFNPIYYLTFLGSTAVFPIGAFFVVGSIQIIIRGHKPGLYSLVSVVVPIMIISLIPSGARGTRYIYHIFPIVILIAGYSLSLLLKYESEMLSNLLSRNYISKYAPIISGGLLATFLLLISAPWINYIYRFTADYYHEEAQLGTQYRNWKDACIYVKEAIEPEDIIITTEALTASFYDCGDIKYALTKRTGSESRLEGIKKIRTLDDLKKVISENPRGWIIIDASRFNSKRYISKKIRDFMSQNLSSLIIDPHGTMIVFSWDEKYFDKLQKF